MVTNAEHPRGRYAAIDARPTFLFVQCCPSWHFKLAIFGQPKIVTLESLSVGFEIHFGRVTMFVRRIFLAVIFGLMVSIGYSGVALAQDEAKHESEIAWFDFENCAICKNMASMKHDMHKVKWEMHMLDKGMLSVSIVPDEMKSKMTKAEEGVQKTVAKLEQGEQLTMCGYCQNYGKLMEMGATFKQLKSLGVDISIVTSDDPDVVKEIHAMAKRAKVEHEKMLKKVASETSAKGE